MVGMKNAYEDWMDKCLELEAKRVEAYQREEGCTPECSSSLEPFDGMALSIDYKCVNQTIHTVYATCIDKLTPPQDCGCGQVIERKP